MAEATAGEEPVEKLGVPEGWDPEFERARLQYEQFLNLGQLLVDHLVGLVLLGLHLVSELNESPLFNFLKVVDTIP